MTAPALVAMLLARGVTFARRNGRLAARPADRLTATELDALRTRKAEVLELLDLAADLEADGEAPRLRALHDDLQESERARLEREARDGDSTAAVVLLVLASMTGGEGLARGAA